MSIGFLLPCIAQGLAFITIQPAEIPDISTVTAIYNQYRTNQHMQYTVLDYRQISGFGDVTYTYYRFSPAGSAIFMNAPEIMMEASYEIDMYPVIMDNSSTEYFYGGPMSIAALEGSNYIDVISNTVIDEDIRVAARTNESYMMQKAIERANISSINPSSAETTAADGSVVAYTVEESYFTNNLQHGANEGKTCTIVAAAILLGFYDYFVDEQIVPDAYEAATGVGTSQSFEILLGDYVYGTGERVGIHLRDASNALNHYLNFNDLNYQFEVLLSDRSAVLNEIVDCVRYQRKPVVASVGDTYGAPWNHSLVVYGVIYENATSSSPSQLRCHMGWGDGANDSRLINPEWVYSCMTLNVSAEGHDGCTVIESADGTVHRMNCAECDYYFTRADVHDFSEWHSNSECHWQTCSFCQAPSAQSSHVEICEYLYAGMHTLTCTVCNHIRYEGHTNYTYVAIDGQHHRAQCSKCTYSYVGSHTWSDWNYYETGTGTERTHYCTSCFYIVTEPVSN